MNQDVMERICPSAEFLAVATLPGYRLQFISGNKSVQAALVEAEDTLMGVCYIIYDSDAHRLSDEGYKTSEVVVFMDGNDDITIRAFTRAPAISGPPVSPGSDTMNLLVEAAKKRELPESYVESLEAR